MPARPLAHPARPAGGARSPRLGAPPVRGTLIPRGTADHVLRRLTPEPERELPTDPVAWVRDELQEHLWSLQRTIARSVVEHRRTMVPACHGPGKSFLAARLAAYWIAAHPPGEAFVVTSAPSGAQVKAILWRELARAHRRAGLPGRIVGLTGSSIPEWHVGPKGREELVAYGRKPQDLASPEEAMQAFSGIHARYVLVILDEATGIPAWLWNAVEGLLSNANARLLAIGNPDDASSQFAKECAPGSGANVIPIPASATPNLSGEWVPEHLRDLLVSETWVQERLERWGPDSPLYQSKVLARFPDTSDDTVVSSALVQAAWSRELEGGEPGAYGLDVARFGRDRTTLYRVRGGVAREVASWAKQDTVQTARRVQAIVGKTPDVPVVVDADGLGAGVFDQLRSAGVRAVPFTLNQAARNPRRFKDRRSEVWWSYRERMAEGLVDLDPADLDLAAQLQQPRWSLDSRGRIKVETKDEMRKRGLPSPDRADAVIMAEECPPPGYAARGKDDGGEAAAPPASSVTADLLRRPM